MLKLLFLTLCVLMVTPLPAEEILTRKDGTRIVILDDGTWKPYSENTTNDRPETATAPCESLIMNVVDKMTGGSWRAARRPLVISDDSKSGFIITLISQGKSSIILNVEVVGASSCIDKNAQIDILFEDNSRMQLKSDNKFNCDGRATVYFGDVFGKESALRRLSSDRILAVRIWTGRSFVEKEFSKENSADFYHILDCLQK